MSGEFEEMADISFTLPGGWTKILTQRKSGGSAGRIDVYIWPPDHSVKLRSEPNLTSFLEKEPHFEIDRNVVNFKRRLIPDFLDEETRAMITKMNDIQDSLTDSKGDGSSRPSMSRPKKRRLYPPQKRRPVQFTESQIRYLRRQFMKKDQPTFDHFVFLSKQVKAEPRDVKEWFIKDRASTLAELEAPGERNPLPFDVTHTPVESECTTEASEDFVIENDNAEIDEEGA